MEALCLLNPEAQCPTQIALELTALRARNVILVAVKSTTLMKISGTHLAQAQLNSIIKSYFQTFQPSLQLTFYTMSFQELWKKTMP